MSEDVTATIMAMKKITAVVDATGSASYSTIFETMFEKHLAKWESQGLIVRGEKALRVTPAGLRLAEID